MASAVARTVGSTATPSVLAIVLDCNPVEWARRADEDLPALLEQLLMFANAYWMLSSANRLIVIGAHPGTAWLIWPEAPEHAAEPAPPHRLRHALARGVEALLDLDPPSESPGAGASPRGPQLAAALSLATLRIARARREQPLLQPRILVLHASADEPSEHLRIVDLAFGNAKFDVVADVVLLQPQRDSLALQQLSHLTGGLYLSADARSRARLVFFILIILHMYRSSRCSSSRTSRAGLSAEEHGRVEFLICK